MTKKLAYVALAAMVVAVAALAVGCGGDEESSTADTAATDDTFMAAMTEHHDAAVEMAEIAQSEADHRQIRELADDIVAAQNDEIDQMAAIHERLFDEPIDHADHGAMGMEAHEMGMDMAPMELSGATPFDREFIDAMVPHHQGAIRMAQIVINQGSDAEIQEMAEGIIDAQSAEIDEMNEWRERWYGAESPAGGVPEQMHSDEMPMHDEMGH
jgi:uncharacterized protein (DUF305 family)